MEKKVVCIDVDGTLADSVKNWLKLLSQEKGIKKELDELTGYKLEEQTGLSTDEVIGLFKKVWSRYNEIELVDSSLPQVVEKLKEKYIIKIVTGSVAKDEELKSWFDLNNIPYDGFFHLKNEKDKLSVDGDIFIEDNGDIAVELAKRGKKVILVEHPWNRKFKKENLLFAKDWGEIEKLLRDEQESPNL